MTDRTEEEIKREQEYRKKMEECGADMPKKYDPDALKKTPNKEKDEKNEREDG